MEKGFFYQIADGRIWNVAVARFVDDVPSQAEVIPLRRGGALGDVSYLRQTLEFYGYTVGDELLTDEDRAKAAREKRDRLLAETDYLLMPDYPIEAAVLEVLKMYRQALRDIPEQSGFPKTIEWPSKPEVIL